jgi:hypothetical protein
MSKISPSPITGPNETPSENKKVGEMVLMYQTYNCLDFQHRIPDGWFDGGRSVEGGTDMLAIEQKLIAQDKKNQLTRELIVIDAAKDKELRNCVAQVFELMKLNSGERNLVPDTIGRLLYCFVCLCVCRFEGAV